MIIIKLILAHLLGDFVLQPDHWVADKEKRKLKSPYLYYHVLLHTALSFLVLWDLSLWYIPVIIGVTHFIIDAAKLQFQRRNNRKQWFFIDQILHLLVIVLVSLPFSQLQEWERLISPNAILAYTALVFLSIPCSVVIKMLLSTWTPLTIDHSKIQTDSLTNAGKYIGILERMMVFIFIALGHWEGVGFMIAAKSVFRFSDLQEAKQRKLTEYVLIGTLLSFGLAITTGLIFSNLTK